MHENDFCPTYLFCFEEWLQKEKRLRIKFKSMFAPFIFFSFIFVPGRLVLLALDLFGLWIEQLWVGLSFLVIYFFLKKHNFEIEMCGKENKGLKKMS